MARVTKKRPTIAFFVSELEGDFSKAVCSGIFDAAEEKDVNLIVLPGKTIKLIDAGQYNYNVIYEYVSHKNVDALVITSSVLCGCISKNQFDAFCLRYKPLPIVSIGIPIKGISNVLINNRTGLKQIINHLIKDHGKRRIAFITGPDEHSEAEERFLVYRDTLKENGLEFDPDLVVPGNFTISAVEDGIKILIDDRKATFDTIVATNDEMAFGVLESLRKRGILVPDQVAVTGFDNGDGAKYANPSLTTVTQPIYELSKKALVLALELIQGKKVGDVVFDTEMVIRESCGCLSETLQAFNSNQLDLELELVAKGGLGPDQFVRRFINQNIEKTDTSVKKFGFLKPFITDWFRIFTQDGLEDQEVEKILRSFKSAIDISNLKENDILTIQTIITNLKKWFDAIADSKSNLVDEDFFQRIRVLLTDTLIKMQGNRLNYQHLEIRNFRVLLAEMVSKSHDYQEQLQSIIPRLHSMGINNCYIYLYDKPVNYHKNSAWRNPAMVNLAMAYNEENSALPEKGCRFPWERVLKNELLPRNKRYTLMFNPLFIEDEHMGLILLEFNMPDSYMFETLVIEMSCALKLSLLFHEREQIENRLKDAVKELADYNESLSNISQTDELTGLYNRRGFMNLANQSLSLARKQGKNGLLFFADIDDLKQINDQYGHDEGDLAIKAMGVILVKTFRASDIIARFGGDEFTIFTVDSGLKLLPKIEERLNKFTKEYNLQSRKPYQLSISIGAVPFQSSECVSLENLMSQADNDLYEEKKRKREN